MTTRFDLRQISGRRIGDITRELRGTPPIEVIMFYDTMEQPILMVPADSLYDREGNYFDTDGLPDKR